MKLLKITILIGAMLSFTACSKSNGGDSEIDPPRLPGGGGGDPDGVSLIFPENNSECTEGVVRNDLQSSVTFEWEAGESVDSYELHLRNLESNSSATTTSQNNEVTIDLERGRPYEWFVVSKKEGTDESPSSAKWRFYNQGPGVENYAPFPAEAIAPTRGQTVNATTSIVLEWQGSDVDNDIVGFEVLFDTNPSPATSLGTTSQNSIDANVGSGQTYFWRVITKDAAGNTSRSEVFDFIVQ
ncbi:hypothetical protein FK220_004355 [Flavobacteriaceae bacterium TP-CH-4]|uniref:Fibronectin type-III domain-containing protein n=1 Tax=Pelagihabitans pacificus TaxID=2696054 RepID=A0A967AXT9_9FLAO|nr:hypothetical protein [Pelagihabitans pacificus]NHF58556.1 hypothetical protein [Pelagihabitans pacificus]